MDSSHGREARKVFQEGVEAFSAGWRRKGKLPSFVAKKP